MPLKEKGQAATHGISLLAVLLGCGLRLSEVVHLKVSHLQQREDQWAIVDLVGKGGHIRTVPVPDWVKARVDDWMKASGTETGCLFRSINKRGIVWGNGLIEKVVWYVVKNFAKKVGIEKVAPHDLRRTCARLCHVAGGELEQIQFLLGHVSVQTTERYLGCKQKIQGGVGPDDLVGIGVKASIKALMSTSDNNRISLMQIRELRTLRFVHEASNVVFLGLPGVGKTHLSVALAEAAIQASGWATSRPERGHFSNS